MGLTTDIGERIELVAMDSHFHDISLALYRQTHDGRPELLVHTYSRIAAAQQRVELVAGAMAILGGMEPVEGAAPRVRFHCGHLHNRACKRVFLEACKLPPAADVQPRPLSVFDKKSNADVKVTGLGGGVYDLTSEGEGDKVAKRRSAIGAGLVKLAEMKWVEDGQERIAFQCGQAHDRLVGLLLVRAQNVRGVEREQQMAASRGQLLAPSAQKQ